VADKTHVEVKKPEISVRFLADFMAASERKRRTIVEGCKYRPLARLFQHKEAPVAIATAIHKGTATPEALKARADAIRNKLASDDFDALTNEANADYVQRFSEVVAGITLPEADILPGKIFPGTQLNGVKVAFSANLVLRRLTKTNKLKRGVLMLRYAKGKALPADVGGFQSAAAYGLLGILTDEEGAEPERGICLTLCAGSGSWFPAPGNSASIFANMKAACESIAERWPAIKPPKGAIL
jgi:hypothetical protein